MKLCHCLVLAAGACAAACSHDQRPAHAAPTTMPTQTALVAAPDRAETQVTPGAPSIPGDPQVAPPVAPAAKPADEAPIASSSSLASPRPDSVPVVPTDPVLDKSHSGRDEESVREIRALLAADKSLSATSRKISVEVRDGRVRLSGQVNTAAERAAIERAARRAANVIDVKNQLVVLE